MLRGERQARLGRCAVLVFGDQPGGVVGGLEGMEAVQEVRHGGEAVDPQQLFFESPDEALRDSVALRLPDVGRAACDAQAPQLVLEVVGAVLAAVVVP